MVPDRFDDLPRTVSGRRRSPLARPGSRCFAGALLVAGALAGWAGSAAAQGNPPAPGEYVLAAGSTYQEGCFPPCACPISLEMPVTGTMSLSIAGQDQLYTTYSVDDVHWLIRGVQGETVVTGSGTYRIGGEVALTQQLTLDLVLGDREVLHFDSGRVPLEDRQPDIIATVSMNGMVCFDRVFKIRARSLERMAQDATFSLVPGASSIALSISSDEASSMLYGTLRLVLDAPGAENPSRAEVRVESADLFAPALSPPLPGVEETLLLTLDPAKESRGTWDPTYNGVSFDLYLVTASGGPAFPMPIRLKGTVDGQRLTVAGDNGDVPDGSVSLTLDAIRLTTRPVSVTSKPGPS